MLDWQEGDDWLISSKGWFCHNFVELENGNRYQVCFFDKGRLVQHLDDNEKIGQSFFIENALIVLSEVTVENMEKAIKEADRQGFFDNLKPINL